MDFVVLELRPVEIGLEGNHSMVGLEIGKEGSEMDLVVLGLLLEFQLEGLEV